MALDVKVFGNALAIGGIVFAPRGIGAGAVHIFAIPINAVGLDHRIDVIGKPMEGGGVAFVKDFATSVVIAREQPFGMIGGEPGDGAADALGLEPDEEFHIQSMDSSAEREEAVGIIVGINFPCSGVEPGLQARGGAAGGGIPVVGFGIGIAPEDIGLHPIFGVSTDDIDVVIADSHERARRLAVDPRNLVGEIPVAPEVLRADKVGTLPKKQEHPWGANLFAGMKGQMGQLLAGFDV